MSNDSITAKQIESEIWKSISSLLADNYNVTIQRQSTIAGKEYVNNYLVTDNKKLSDYFGLGETVGHLRYQ